MKYCTKCGEQLDDDAVFCSKCGQRCDGSSNGPESYVDNNFDPNNFGPNQYRQNYNNNPNNPSDSNKPLRGTGMGVLFGLLLGLIGYLLIIFLGDSKAKKGCLIAFCVNLVASIILGILTASAFGTLIFLV